MALRVSWPLARGEAAMLGFGMGAAWRPDLGFIKVLGLEATPNPRRKLGGSVFLIPGWSPAWLRLEAGEGADKRAQGVNNIGCRVRLSVKRRRGGKASAWAQLAGWASLVTRVALGVGPTSEAPEQ